MSESEINNLNPEQQSAVEAIMAGKNVFLTGGAGVGKTKTVMFARDALTEAGKKVACVAPTGHVAKSVGGVTLHSFLGLKRCLLRETEHGLMLVEPDLSAMRKIDVLFCDEVSMVDRPMLEILWSGIESLREKGHHVQVVFTGDFYQLPPVITREQRSLLEQYYGAPIHEGFAFESECWDKFEFEYIMLTRVMRQKDAGFVNMLNRVREGDKSVLETIKTFSSQESFPDALWIVSHRDIATRINNQYLKDLSGPTVVMKAQVEGVCPNVSEYVTEELVLKANMKVVITVNIPQKKITNGTEAIVSDWTSDVVHVTIPNRKSRFSIERYAFYPEYTDDMSQPEFIIYQFPLVAGYARTIHGSQGCTRNYVNLSIKQCWSCGQLYVCLSRVESLDHLYMDVSSSDLIKSLHTSPTVKNWYEKHFPWKGAVTTLNGEVSAETLTPIAYSWDSGLRFGLMPFNFVVNGQPTRHIAVVLRSQNNRVVMLTDLDKFFPIQSGGHSMTSGTGSKAYHITSYLNYLLNDAKIVSKVIEIMPEHASAYLCAYGLGIYGDRKRTKETINICHSAVFHFMRNLSLDPVIGPKLGYTADDLVISKPTITAGRYISYRYETVFSYFYDPEEHEIVRDIPAEAIPILLDTALHSSPQLFMMMTTQLCTLARPSEVCNISDRNTRLVYEGNRLTTVQFDLQKKMILRSDLVPVGGIKKQRIVRVHPLFAPLFNEAYPFWKKHRLTPCAEDIYYAPWFINAAGRAETYANYYHAFHSILPAFVSALEATGDPKLCLYADLVRTENISMHIMRHISTVFLVLAGSSAEEIMSSRGDSSIESARVYIENKGIIMKHVSEEVNILFKHVREAVTGLKKRERQDR